MKLRELRELLKGDFGRGFNEKEGKSKVGTFFHLYLRSQGYKYVLYMRLSKYFYSKKLCFPIYVLCRMMLRRCKIKYGIDIPCHTKIGKGLLISHFGGIFFHENAIIGDNCFILNGVTVGNNCRTDDAPVIGDSVFIGTGAKIIGDVKVGNNVKIGANAVVVKDIPDNSIVGAPLGVILNKV